MREAVIERSSQHAAVTLRFLLPLLVLLWMCSAADMYRSRLGLPCVFLCRNEAALSEAPRPFSPVCVGDISKSLEAFAEERVHVFRDARPTNGWLL